MSGNPPHTHRRKLYRRCAELRWVASFARGQEVGAGGDLMSSSELIRWSGLAAVAGGVSLAAAELVTLSFFGYDFSRTATTGTYALYSALIMIAGLLLPL